MYIDSYKRLNFTIHHITMMRITITKFNVSGKRDRNIFLVIYSTKLRRSCWNLVHGFL